MAKKDETILQKAITDAIAARYGTLAHVVRVNSGSVPAKRGWIHLAPKGTPDLHVDIAGASVWIEVKLPGETSDATQLQVQGSLRMCGAYVYEVHSVAEALSALEAVRLVQAQRERDGALGAKFRVVLRGLEESMDEEDAA